MIPTNAPLFRMLSTRLGWLSQRQVVIGQNIANADTPDYRARDLRPGDFESMARTIAGQGPSIGMATTAKGHIEGGRSASSGLSAETVRRPYETSPDGNAVVLEEQMAKAGRTALDHQLATNLYRKYVGMVKTALGTPQ